MAAFSCVARAELIVGTDLNSNNGANTAINQLYAGNRGSNGGGDQSLQFGDIIQGTASADVLVGGLGIDVLLGGNGDDVIIGGTEDFNSANRDRAFGEAGQDIFIWTPGDGNDFFDGGAGTDVLILGLVGEEKDGNGNTEGAPFFSVNPPNRPGSQDFDGIFIDPVTELPVVDVVGGPGFCEVLDRQTDGMDELGLDNLVRFILRGPANAFEDAIAADPDADQNTLDTGLRIAVHLKQTEFVVCGSRDGNEIEVFDLRQTPVAKVSISELPEKAYNLVIGL
ncbi:MAG: hypothetical protein MI864_15170 [Pseudomonadales bacterium]|nr:hypothetical protein [Pseudomonadales bacterium]